MKCTASKKIYGMAIAFSLTVIPGAHAARQAEKKVPDNEMLPVSFDSTSNANHDLFREKGEGVYKPVDEAPVIDDLFFDSSNDPDKAIDELNGLNDIYLATLNPAARPVRNEKPSSAQPAEGKRLMAGTQNSSAPSPFEKKRGEEIKTAKESLPYSVSFDEPASHYNQSDKQSLALNTGELLLNEGEQSGKKLRSHNSRPVNNLTSVSQKKAISSAIEKLPQAVTSPAQKKTGGFFSGNQTVAVKTTQDNIGFYSLAKQKQEESALYEEAFPARAKELGFSEAMKRAVLWHPLIKRSQEELVQSIESINEAKASYFPALDAGIKSGFEQNNYTNRNERTSKAVLTANQMIYDFGKTESRVSLAKSNSTMTEANLHKNINDIMYESASAWLQVNRYKKLITIAKAQVAGFKTINEMARKRTALGASARSEYSQSKVRLASASALLYDYIAQYNRWTATLSNIVNLSPVSVPDVDVPSGLDSVCYRIDTRNLISPVIEVARNQVKVAKDQVSASRSEHYPTLTLSPTYEYKIYDDSNSYKNSNGKNGEFGIFLNISAPLYKGGALDSRTRQAEQALYAAQHNVDLALKETERKIIESRSQIENTRLSLNAKKTREKEAIQTRDLYMMQYIELGTRSFSDLLSAESEIHQTKMDIANGSYSIANFSLECLYQSGQLEKKLNGSYAGNAERSL